MARSVIPNIPTYLVDKLQLVTKIDLVGLRYFIDDCIEASFNEARKTISVANVESLIFAH